MSDWPPLNTPGDGRAMNRLQTERATRRHRDHIDARLLLTLRAIDERGGPATHSELATLQAIAQDQSASTKAGEVATHVLLAFAHKARTAAKRQPH